MKEIKLSDDDYHTFMVQHHSAWKFDVYTLYEDTMIMYCLGRY